MIVLAVISILTVVTVPKYTAMMEHYRLESSARSVMERVHYAKQLAMEQRQNVYIGLTAENVRLLSGSAPPLQAVDEAKHFDIGVSFFAGASVGLLSFADGSVPYQGFYYNFQGFVFGAGGAPSELVISLQGRQGQTVEIHTNALIGSPTLVWP